MISEAGKHPLCWMIPSKVITEIDLVHTGIEEVHAIDFNSLQISNGSVVDEFFRTLGRITHSLMMCDSELYIPTKAFLYHISASEPRVGHRFLTVNRLQITDNSTVNDDF